MATFPSWSTVTRDPLLLPIPNADGVEHTYEIPPLGYVDELRIREAQRAVREAIPTPGDQMDGDDGDGLDGVAVERVTDEQFFRMLLGPSLDLMRADNVPSIAITHAAAVAHADATAGRAVALYTWTKGLDPKAVADDMERIRTSAEQARILVAKKPAKKTGKKTGNKTGARKTTRSRR